MGQVNTQNTNKKTSSGRLLEADLVKASFMRRLGAACIDQLIIWTIVIVIGNITYPADYFYNERIAGIFFTGGLIALFLYFWILTSWKQLTIGKKLLKIKVINVRGRRPGWLRVLWRESVGRIVLMLSLLVEGLFLIISNMTAYSLSRTTMITYPEYGYRKAIDREPVNVLGFFDRFSGTYVIKTESNRQP